MIDLKPFADTLKGQPVAVFGLGLSNNAAIAALLAAGIAVTAWDDEAGNRDAAQAMGAKVSDLLKEDLTAYACLVLSPGIPFTHNPHPVVARAQAAGIEIVCDIEILHCCHHGRKTIGITGTNGKSTTTALIGHILNASGISAAVGGNIGTAALALGMPPENGVFVLELSSYQLDLCPTFAPDIAVHLNLSPDHIDRHGTFENYAAAKTRIFRGEGIAIVGPGIKGTGIRSVANLAAAPVENLKIDSLRGVHNQQNMAAAFLAARAVGLKDDAIIAAIKTFPGLNHRQYPVRIIGNISYINDSKATNADATARALASFDDIYWIVGGKAKEGGLAGLEIYKDKIRHAFVIGEAAPDFMRWLAHHNIAATLSHTLEQAVQDAHTMTRDKSGVVLLSPACASFDQFKNFEQRGDIFAALVAQLEG